jgi:hypothetical protein
MGSTSQFSIAYPTYGIIFLSRAKSIKQELHFRIFTFHTYFMHLGHLMERMYAYVINLSMKQGSLVCFVLFCFVCHMEISLAALYAALLISSESSG